MKLKTYSAGTMAQALAQVRKDLGEQAVIVHTRSYKTGSWFGLGGRAVVEITASSALPDSKPKRASRSSMRENAPVREQPRERANTTTNKKVIDDRAALFEPKPTHQPKRPPRMTEREAPAPKPRDPEPRDLGPIEFIPEPPARAPEPPKPAAKDPEPEHAQPERPFPKKPNPISTEPERVERPVAREPVAKEPVARDLIKQEPPKQAPPKQEQIQLEQTKQTPHNAGSEIESKIASLEQMMSKVLESTRRTDHALSAGAALEWEPAGTERSVLAQIHARLVESEVPLPIADAAAHAARERLDADELTDESAVRHEFLRDIESRIRTIGSAANDTEGDRAVIALVGPTGVGKTTTVAKLAARAKLRANRTVGLITSDTYRIGAVEQLKTYADIVGLELRVASTPEEMREQIDALEHCDLVVVDTAGRSQHNTERLVELERMIAAANPSETHLVVSSTVSPKVIASTAQNFRVLRPDRCVLTKLDECVSTGVIARMEELVALPMSYVTVGQEVPDDLLIARASRLARAVLEGPRALRAGAESGSGA